METGVEPLPLQLSEASGVPFYRQVVDQIAHLIRSGQQAPGDRLPSVRELSAQVRVSLITVRRAYADLEAAGLIVRRQGQGTFVARDVEATSRDRALSEARDGIAEAVARARQLGLTGRELRRCVESLLHEEGGSDGKQ
jgi:GntR family transcriptional regulator